MNKCIIKITFFAFCLSSLQSVCGSQAAATTSSSKNNLLSSSWKIACAIGFGIATPLLGYLAYHEHTKLNTSQAISDSAKKAQEDVKEHRIALISSIQNQKKNPDTIALFESLFWRYMQEEATPEYQALSGEYNKDFSQQEPNKFGHFFDAMPLHQNIAHAKNAYSRQKIKFGFATAATILSAGTAGGLALWQLLSKK